MAVVTDSRQYDDIIPGVTVQQPAGRAKLRHEVERDLAQLLHQARLCNQTVGDQDHPTAWDIAHRRINTALDVREKAPVSAPVAP